MRQSLRGQVFYGLNSMWWVVAGGEVRNVSSHELFDCNPTTTPHRDPARALSRVKALLQQAVGAEDFAGAARLKARRDEIEAALFRRGAAA